MSEVFYNAKNLYAEFINDNKIILNSLFQIP